MPFTQQRAITLLTAAHQFERGIDKALSFMMDARQLLRRKQITKEEAWDRIEQLMMMPEQLVDDYATVKTVLAVERYHFQKFGRRNERNAIKQAARRRKNDIPERPAANTEFGLAPVKIEQMYNAREHHSITQQDVKKTAIQMDTQDFIEKQMREGKFGPTEARGEVERAKPRLSNIEKFLQKNNIEEMEGLEEELSGDKDDELF